MDTYIEKKVIPLVDQHGWMVQSVGAGPDTLCFSYTVGLCQTYRQPDILTFGLPPYLAQVLLNDLATSSANQPLSIDTPLYDYVRDMPIVLRPVHASYLAASCVLFNVGRAYYASSQTPLVALQLIWPDASGRFPWNGGQPHPLLDTPGLAGYENLPSS